uniref:KID domain-containing protein n=1 Tax=Steinernema glaseri TaxID=37863 RepID=A0A1I7ZCQ2_9BILA
MESDDKKEIFDGLEGSDGGLKQERRTLSALEDPRSRTAKSKTSVLLLSGSRYVPMETEGPHQKEASPSSPVPSHPLDQHVPSSCLDEMELELVNIPLKFPRIS